MEMHLARGNITHFSMELNISFELNVLESKGFEHPTISGMRLQEGEALAVNMSIDAINNMTMKSVDKIEKFLLAPKIKNLVVSVLTTTKAVVQVPPWQSIFMAGGLAAMAFINFTNTRAEYLI